MEAFEISHSKMVFIGDSLDRDVAGAKSVGLSAIWIDHGMQQASAGITRPDLVIHDLWDLLEI
jgi:FMN phosphatase YigB (HAD superfamily)